MGAAQPHQEAPLHSAVEVVAGAIADFGDRGFGHGVIRE